MRRLISFLCLLVLVAAACGTVDEGAHFEEVSDFQPVAVYTPMEPQYSVVWDSTYLGTRFFPPRGPAYPEIEAWQSVGRSPVGNEYGSVTLFRQSTDAGREDLVVMFSPRATGNVAVDALRLTGDTSRVQLELSCSGNAAMLVGDANLTSYRSLDQALRAWRPGPDGTLVEFDPKTSTATGSCETVPERDRRTAVSPGPGSPDQDATLAAGAQLFQLSVEAEFADGPYDVAVTPGWVWAAANGGLHRIDPETGSIDTTIDLPAIYKANIEVGETAVWITHGATLSRVDPETAAVTGNVALEEFVKGRTRPLAVGHGAVWVAASDRRLLRIDQETLEVTRDRPLAYPPGGLAFGADSLWALVAQNVLRIDPTTLEGVAIVQLPKSVFHPSIGTALTYGQDSVWVSVDGGLARVDPTTNEVFSVIDDPSCCGAIVGFAGDQLIAYAPGLLDKNITVVDPDTGELEPVFTTRSAVFAIVGDSTGFWAAAPRSGMLYRLDAATD